MTALKIDHDSQQTFARGVDCRVFERYECRIDSQCQPVAARGDGELSWEATIKDVSAGGLGLIAIRRFEPGTGLAIQLCDGNEEKSMLAKVVHVHHLPTGEWLIGCAFLSPIDEDEVQRLAASATAQETATRELRLPSVTAVNGHVTNTTVESPEAVQLTNVRWYNLDTGQNRVSRCSALKGFWPFTADKKLRFTVKAKSGGQELTRMIVHYCSQRHDEWIVYFSLEGQPSSRWLQWFSKPVAEQRG